MNDFAKLETVSKFINSIRDIEVKDLTIELRGFNSGYFVNEEIPRPYQKLQDYCLARVDQVTQDNYCGYNNDGLYLKKILEEMEQDTCENKALLILSDGRPAPASEYPHEDLDRVVNERLVKSNIPYISIGIMDKSVLSHYPKAKVAKSTGELANMLSIHSRELIKF